MSTPRTGGAQTSAVAAALASVVLGLVVVAATFMEWVDLGSVGLAPLNPNGFGVHNGHYAQTLGTQLTLGWFTTALGLLIIIGGLLVLFAVVRRVGAPHPGFALVAGAGVGVVVMAGAVPVRPLGLTLPLGQIGATSAAADVGEPTAGLFLLLAAALTSVVLGLVGVSLTGRESAGAARRLLAIAIVVGALIGVIAVALVWWWLGRDAALSIHGFGSAPGDR
ncbi:MULTISPECIES: hypothetical protein [Gordonia]|uniref:Uncharacterized protein n=1 Tax=Gordonia amicalis TaxID=89053 RepID=A0AAE4U7L6_9ACTN|nr:MULTISPECIES: hypothetical protein [Gordonia]ATD70639.1 hypothetical protein CNO18_10495 [Gordonia sp. 1D]MCZ4577649.1 hypothetical protein [Gordonia amicalis]MCZ4651278.1 hypothetical protein [Gordonia amicalis]MDJ0451356.1 hypothetical protein [Gordonia amicalis]MDV6310473.1 hypothetical protein [Gordonia amicalis]